MMKLLPWLLGRSWLFRTVQCQKSVLLRAWHAVRRQMQGQLPPLAVLLGLSRELLRKAFPGITKESILPTERLLTFSRQTQGQLLTPALRLEVMELWLLLITETVIKRFMPTYHSSMLELGKQ